MKDVESMNQTEVLAQIGNFDETTRAVIDRWLALELHYHLSTQPSTWQCQGQKLAIERLSDQLKGLNLPVGASAFEPPSEIPCDSVRVRRKFLDTAQAK